MNKRILLLLIVLVFVGVGAPASNCFGINYSLDFRNPYGAQPRAFQFKERHYQYNYDAEDWRGVYSDVSMDSYWYDNFGISSDNGHIGDLIYLDLVFSCNYDWALNLGPNVEAIDNRIGFGMGIRISDNNMNPVHLGTSHNTYVSDGPGGGSGSSYGTYTATVVLNTTGSEKPYGLYQDVELSLSSAGLALLYPESGESWPSNYATIMAYGAWELESYDIRPVPEPSTLLLLGSGLAGLIGFRSKGKTKKSLRMQNPEGDNDT